VWIGIYPAPILRRTEPSAARFVRSIDQRGSAVLTRTAMQAR
jgi:hypothetical protein